ncbi:MAG: GMC family oxidoreductase [Rhodospirillaceae bacterium]|nr:GMC family oxidoreductase [Rhodospirillales bacterium]
MNFTVNFSGSDFEQIEADVIIIGAGMYGGLMADRLAAPGRRVVMLDAGPMIDRVEAVDRFRASTTKGNNAPYVNAPWAPCPDDMAPAPFYGSDPMNPNKDGQTPFAVLYLRGVGGTSWHFTAHAERFQPNDFRMKSLYGVGADWPVTYDELQPYYAQAEQEWGVAGGPATMGPPRDTPYPMPPVPQSFLDERVSDALQKTGYKGQVLGFPHARNSVPGYGGRPQCCGNASCRFICPIGAKYDGSVHVMKAVSKGALLLPERVVYAIDVGADKQISGLRYVTSKGKPGLAKAKTYILAAHAIETPKLLLMSAGVNAPRGVANSSGLVGRNLMCNVDVDSFGWAKNPVWPYRGPVSATSGIDGYRDGAFRTNTAAAVTLVINGGFNPSLGPFQEVDRALEENRIGKNLRQRVHDLVATEVVLSSSVEVLPSLSNTIVPDPSRRDELGIPLPKVDFSLDEYTIRGCHQAFDRQMAILKQMDAKIDTEKTSNPNKPTVDGAIMAGTAKMGISAMDSVVNPFGRSHDHKNLFIIGTANYPTVTVCSPSLTAAALAIRAADHIAKHDA